jgi:hypothetical protein
MERHIERSVPRAEMGGAHKYHGIFDVGAMTC